MTGILFLDRDGVLNEPAPEGDYVTSVADLRVLPGVPEALTRVCRTLSGVPIVVVTNQRGIALGRMSAASVDAINGRLLDDLRRVGGKVDAFEVCPHDIGVCDCREPRLGMFHRALARFPGTSAGASVVVGDSLSDLRAGAALSARTVLVGGMERRARVRAAAQALGVPVRAEAESLAALVDSGLLVAWLGEPPVAA